MRKGIFIFFNIVLLVALQAITISVPDFNELQEDVGRLQIPGEPAIPYLNVPVLLAQGQEVTSVNVEFSGDRQSITSYIPPAQMPVILSAQDFSLTEPDTAIYSSSDLYPSSDFRNLGTQRLNGYDVLYLHIFPYKYNPQNDEIFWQNTITVNINTEYNEDLKSAQNRKLLAGNNLPLSLAGIYGLENQDSYRKEVTGSFRTLADPSEPYSMILITSNEVIDWFLDFLQWKSEHGLETGVFFTEDIYDEYEGVNQQEKIKNFIIDAYETWSMTGSPLEYVILGGDDEIIPIRGVFINAGGTVDNNLPCDLYYSCLDNDWDGNENGIYGEVEDDVDLVPEIAISRLPVDNELDLINWFNKVTHYVDENTYSNNIVETLGEFLWGNPDTWGGDSMDLLLEHLDEPFHVQTMYQRDGTYDEYGVTQSINGGVGFVNHLGHANEFFVFGQNRVSAASYNNTEYGFAYTQGCYPAAFDESTGQSGECIAENFIIRPGGFFGFIGNSRYGWGIPGQPANGPSQRYHLPFIQAIFELDIREFGKALAYSREVMIDAALESPHLRWVHYELTLFGDPSISLKEPDPDFPYINPQPPIYSDIEGDGDGAINPGETIEISIPLTADFNWGNAEAVSAVISFTDPTLSASIDSVYYGYIGAGETISAASFLVQVPQDVVYDAYPYKITVKCPVGTDSEFNKSYDYNFEVSIQQTNWPWFLAERLSVAPLLADLDDDGDLDILATTMSGDMYGLNIFAEEMADFPWMTGETIEKHTALGDVDNDDEPEIVLATRSGNIYARNLDGSVAWQYEHGADQLLTPVLADIDGDGLLEALSLGMDGNLLAIDENGNLENGFPIVLGQLVFQEIAAADIDNDSAAEIAVATQNGFLHLFNYDGSEVAGFPVDLGNSPASGTTILDNYHLTLSTNSQLLVITPAGVIITAKDIDSRVVSAPVAGNYDADEELEIAFTTQFGVVYICDQDGTDLAGWPVDLNCSISQPPLAVDLNDDDALDLIWFSATNTLYAYNNDGTEIPFSPVPIGFNDNFPASIADLDDDNDFEIVFSTSNRVIVVDSKLPSGTYMPWSTYRGNDMRTGFFGDNLLTDNDPDQIMKPVSCLLANYPNPFNPETAIRFYLADNSCHTVISIYNIKGQKIFSEEYQNLAAGEHELIWNGKDLNNHPAASGIYFYKLNVDGVNGGIRRMILLK
ncbi:MAG: T9SS type A sorting domain-containing protein [Candidatus Cloacimonetes bacterium]|nr:T9SS type A sorting domain-containing protein [Candidatus Cloacimonadota bacterium]